MTSLWVRLVDKVATIAIIALVILVGFLVYRRYSSSPEVLAVKTEEIRPGMVLSARQDGWKKGHKTIFLALSTDCVHCSNEALFYKQATDAAKRFGVDVLEWFPQPVGDSSAWLKRNGVSVSGLQRVSLSSIGVVGTPTIGIADETGTIKGVWTGELIPREQAFVLAWIRGVPGVEKDLARSGGAPELISLDAYELSVRSTRHQLLDIQVRDYYHLGHKQNAINIPFDELDSRAIHELVPAERTIIDCTNVSMRFCQLATRDLYYLGFENVSMLVKTSTPATNGDAGIARPN